MRLDPRYRKLILSFFLILSIVLVFTFFDYLSHQYDTEYSVPSRYFPNKIIFGSIFGFFIFLLLGKQNPFEKSLIFSFTVSVFLQIRYFLEGYPKDFVFLFLGVHFVLLFLVSYAFFWLLKWKKIQLV